MLSSGLDQSGVESRASAVRELDARGKRGAVNVGRVAERLGCKVEDARLGGERGGIEAMLLPDRDSDLFTVRVDPTPHRGWSDVPADLRTEIAHRRRRFRVAHELAHTLFYDRRPGRAPERAAAVTEAEEQFCDEFARALLVPPAAARVLPTTAESVFTLEARFDVSLELAARALARSQPGILVALWYWPPNSPAQAGSLLRQWCSAKQSSLRRWRENPIVNRALACGEATGYIPALEEMNPPLWATARADQRRRQLLLVAGQAKQP